MTRSPETPLVETDLSRALAYAATAVAAFLVVTCSAAAQAPATVAPVDTAAPRSTPNRTPAAGRPVAASASPATSRAAPGSPVVGVPELARFGKQLEELAAKERAESVRVLWLGDSHAAADFWPNVVREALQSRFGNGGPGFLFAGLRVYRHSGVLVTRSGGWRVQPRAPSLWTVQGDGIYGLGGMRTVPLGAASKVELKPRDGATVAPTRWSVTYRLPRPASRFTLRWPSGSRTVRAEGGAAGAVEAIHLDGVDGPLVIEGAVGEPEIFGAIAESATPGVVVDTLGINGARVGTPVAWDRASWVAEVRARKPGLAVLAYGTNEAGDAVVPSRYAAQFEELVSRLREAEPNIDCWILGPTDRAAPNWQTLSRVVEIDAVQRDVAAKLGCAYTSVLALMGGEGSLKKWAEQSPPLAGQDRVHLTPRGYRELGQLTAERLFHGLGVTAKQ